jgi:RND family efflux transporter MFP subunit
MSKLNPLLIAVIVVAVSAAGYVLLRTDESSKVAPGSSIGNNVGGNANNKPVTVATVLAQKRDFAVKLSANGVVTALNTVEIRPQLSSTIAKVHIKEGQFVRKGELLFTLDNRADEVNLAKAQAQLDKELATLADNQRQFNRSKELFEKKFLAQSAVDSSQTGVQAQQAVVAGAKSAVAAARVSLTYTQIVAPASGRTGIISVFPGSLVQANGAATPMVTITQMDPIAITFPLPQRNLSDALESMKRADSFVLGRLPDNPLQFKGSLQFIDNAVDAASGTVKVKAVFENKEMKLWPGAYANIELSVQTIKDAIVVPQDAIIVGAKAKSVYVVDADGKAALRQVNVLQSFGSDVVVSGIDAGAKVILEGKQNLRAGALVKELKEDAKSGNKDGIKAEVQIEKPAKSKVKSSAASAAAASAS